MNNAHGMYWKRSKNFADRKSYHIEDSLFLTAAGEKNTLKLYKSYFFKNILDDSYGIEHTYLPGGAYTFRMRNVTYAGTRQHGGTGALVSPQASYAKFVDKLFVIVKGFLYRY